MNNLKGFTSNVLVKEHYFLGYRYWFVSDDDYKLIIFKFKKPNLYTELKSDTIEGKYLYTLAFFMSIFTPWLFLNAENFNKHLASLKTSWYNKYLRKR